VKERARQLGFSSVGIADLAPTPHATTLQRWLESGYAGTMRYMHRQATRRKEPARIVPGAIRAIVVLYNYYHPTVAPGGSRARIAMYAWGRDYHLALVPPLEDLARLVASLGDANSVARAYIDAGPVPERELAQRAGLGWIGKNTMLIDPRRGSFTLIGSVLTNVDLAVDAPFQSDRCGSCTRCLEACPTDAFPAPRVLDATRCISYLTIEHHGAVPSHLAEEMGNWVFGCDICQEVCPWNEKFARPADDRWLDMRDDRAWVPLDEFEQLEPDGFAHRYGETALSRPGLAGMKRNAAVARRNVESASDG
jgi:epoxyqueuosine reductase